MNIVRLQMQSSMAPLDCTHYDGLNSQSGSA